MSEAFQNKDRAFKVSAVSGPPENLRRVMQETPRLLLVRLRSLGDSILTLPLLEALHDWRPDLQTDVLVEAPFAPVFYENASVHEILVLRSRNDRDLSGWSRKQAILQIRRRDYPIVLNLHGGTTSQILSLLSGAGLRVGQESHRKSWIYNVRIPLSSTVWGRDRLHTAEHQLALLRWLRSDDPRVPPARMHLRKEARESAGRRLAGMDLEAGRYFLIHPTATLQTKQWPEANFARLADRLSRHYGLPALFTAAPHEAQVLLNIGKHASARHFYRSDLGLEELFALIEGARVFIGNDSGPTHAAAALRRPVVVVWGSSNFDAWHPWQTDFEAIRSDLPCVPCPGYKCAVFGEPKCIQDITVDAVFAACDRLLVRSTGGID